MSLEQEGLVLRRAVQALGPVKHARRFDGELRGQLTRHMRARVTSGETHVSIARSLDLSKDTMQRMLRAPSLMVPVRVVSHAVKASTLVLRGPCGVVVEGATLSEMADLLRRLSSCSV